MRCTSCPCFFAWFPAVSPELVYHAGMNYHGVSGIDVQHRSNALAGIQGEHWIIEFHGCPDGILNDPDRLRLAVDKACKAGGLNLLERIDHTFTPQGVTILGLLAESHISIHTWPEEEYAAIDIFTCGRRGTLDKALDSLVADLTPENRSCRVIRRGR